MNWLRSIDRELFLLLNWPVGRRAPIDMILRGAAHALVLQGVLLLLVYLALRRHLLVEGLLTAALAAAFALLLRRLLPLHVTRLLTTEPALRLALGAGMVSDPPASSFPSAVTALFAALALPLWPPVEQGGCWLGVSAMMWIVTAICLPRVALGYEWPSDVFAGAVLAAFSHRLVTTSRRSP